MYDLVLIKPPDPALEDPTMYFPLGLLYLSSIAKMHGYSVKVLDCRMKVPEIPPARFYGFSCDTPHITAAKSIAKLVTGKTIVGGTHPTVMTQECTDDFDYVVVGEGEKALIEILEGRAEKGIVHGESLQNIDSIPLPDWDAVDSPFSYTLFPGQRYGTGELAATILGSRGCPMQCAFCANVFPQKVRFRSVGNIYDELKQLKDRGIRHLRFEDDNITLHPEFRVLCEAISFFGFKWKGHTRSDLLCKNPELATYMANSGCEECGLGVESADDEVLKLINKRERAVHHYSAVKILHEAGMRAKTYFISGLPGETDVTMMLNREFMRQARPDKWTLSTFTPYPGCDIFRHPDKYGVEIKDWDYEHWWNFVFSASDNYVHVLNGQTQTQMKKRHDDFRKFLLNEEWRTP